MANIRMIVKKKPKKVRFDLTRNIVIEPVDKVSRLEWFMNRSIFIIPILILLLLICVKIYGKVL